MRGSIKFKWSTEGNKATLNLIIKIKGQLDTEFLFTDFDTQSNRDRMLFEALNGILWLSSDGIIKDNK